MEVINIKVLQNYSPLLISKFGNRTYWLNGEQITDYHLGIDIVANIDGNSGFDYILAVASGTVELVVNDIAGYVGGASYGNQIVINHGNGYKTRCAHLKQNSIPLKVGGSVKTGQVIGYMGTTGTITAGHLHFEVIKDGSVIDPYDYVFGDKTFEDTKVDEPNTGNEDENNDSSGDIEKTNFWSNLFKKIKDFFKKLFRK